MSIPLSRDLTHSFDRFPPSIKTLSFPLLTAAVKKFRPASLLIASLNHAANVHDQKPLSNMTHLQSQSCTRASGEQELQQVTVLSPRSQSTTKIAYRTLNTECRQHRQRVCCSPPPLRLCLFHLSCVPRRCFNPTYPPSLFLPLFSACLIPKGLPSSVPLPLAPHRIRG